MKKWQMFFGSLVLLLSVLLFNTLTFGQVEKANVAQVTINLDEQVAVAHMAKAITFKTISYRDRVVGQPFIDFIAFLEVSFPKTFDQLEVTKINDYALVLKWQGSDDSLLPALMLAHSDVVPVEPSSLEQWRFEPFSGEIKDGFIWGRGALDDKASLISSLEAVEFLLSQGHQPLRSFYFAFGHDEEVGGELGAKKIAKHFDSLDLKFAYIVDEGGLIANGMVPGVSKPVALIGPAEKGFVTLDISVTSAGGHSSTPPKHSAVGRLATAIAKLEAFDFEVDLSGVKNMAYELADDLPFAHKLVFANTWLFAPVLEYVLTQKPELAAGIRTTIAPTVFNAGIQENILPTSATALVNFRILPGNSIEQVIATVINVIDDDQVTIKQRQGGFGSEPSKVTNTNSAPYLAMKKSIQQVLGQDNIAIAPRIVVGATDTRHFNHLSDNSLHFVGIDLSKDQLTGIHGIDERLSIKGYINAIKIYVQMIKNSD
ncbi:M20/M25/M40 family metallo-hydrolase [Colwellia piezophila]|uniref:M20/M25/M40 family metallo-hydrolase n=1 Tax=Colwellia piezophila TaxID=211668 RepID=UPI0003762D3F|nr:M20/M25/M40 family metallo-hydrolase [Colwellia piezophila]